MNIIIPIRRYCNGSAAMNRLIGYAKGFAFYNINVWIYFLITDKNEERLIINNPKIHIVNLWEKDSSFWRKKRFLELVKNLFILKNKVSTGNIIFLYGRVNYLYFTMWSLRKKNKIFCEITEHPEYRKGGVMQKISIGMSLFFIRNFHGLFVISNTLKQFFISSGVEKTKIDVINMFVDSSRFEGIDKKGGEKYIAYCGYVSRRKDGVDLLIESFALFHVKHKDYKLYIIGKGGFPEPLSFFEQLSINQGVRDSVVFTEEVSSEKMPELLVNADILVLARPDSLQARNGFPTKLGEYLSTGNPIVVTNVGEIPLFIKDKINGIIAEESNVKDFAEKLSWVVEHPEQAKEIGKNGKKLVNSEFSYLEQSKKALSFIIKNLYSL